MPINLLFIVYMHGNFQAFPLFASIVFLCFNWNFRVETQDGGDAKVEASPRDIIYTQSAESSEGEEPTILHKLDLRYGYNCYFISRHWLSPLNPDYTLKQLLFVSPMFILARKKTFCLLSSCILS